MDHLGRMVAGGFSEMNQKFKQVDQRFEQMGNRLDNIEERLIRMEHNHGARIEILEDKLARQ